MYCCRKITDDVFWVGAGDRRIALFENIFPVERGMSYNAYLLTDQKTVLLDTVDPSVSKQFFENLEHVLGTRKLDYLVVNHMEPDHCGTLKEVLLKYPDVRIVGNAKTLAMIKQFFDIDIENRFEIVSEGSTLETGRHTLSFAMAPMVHWPEAMVTYDAQDKILFSADAFGTFGAINGNLFADEVDFERDWLEDARRYYANIVGKYGVQVQALLKKAEKLDIQMICPLHGLVWREQIEWFIDKYQKWSSYTPEENSVLIVYGSIYGNTENAVDILAARLSENGVKNILIRDVSAVHPSFIVSDCFRYSHIVFASVTYNAGIFSNMETVLLDLKAHNLQNRTAAVIQNGSWAPSAGKQMKEILDAMKNVTVLESTVQIKSGVKEEQLAEIEQLANELTDSLNQNKF